VWENRGSRALITPDLHVAPSEALGNNIAPLVQTSAAQGAVHHSSVALSCRGGAVGVSRLSLAQLRQVEPRVLVNQEGHTGGGHDAYQVRT
jgi:hypothetical protein